MSHHSFWRIAVGILLLLSATAAFGQNTIISGTVTDQQGSAIANAAVTVTNKALGTTRSVTTTGDGSYQIPQVPPGLYRVRAEAPGFKAVIVEEVQVLVSTPLTLNLTFTEVGAVTESVTVSGGETTINTTDATIGNSFNSVKVVDLPLNARNVVDLLSLQPGVTTSGEVNGGRSSQANVTLDGVDVNDQQSGLNPITGQPFNSVLRSTPDSLQEFRVVTTNPNADQGRSSGAQVSLVTKSGTNEFHGSLYEYHRNTVTTANDWFNNKAGVARPALLRNNFGGSIGGPVKKDKVFFFFTYEGFREAKSQSVVQVVPLKTLGQGIVRYKTADGSSDASCPAGTPSGVRCLTAAQVGAFYLAANGVNPGFNPAALSTLAAAAQRYPANDTTQGDGLNTGGYRFNSPAPVRYNTYIAKFDANLTSRQTLFARVNYQNDTITGAKQFPDTPAPQTWVHPKGVAIGHGWTITNALVNNFRYGLTRDSFTRGGDSSQNNIYFRYVYYPAAFSRSLERTTPVHNFVDDLSWTKGNHSMQYGANIRLIKNSRVSFGSAYDNAGTNPSYYDASGDVVLFDEANGDPIFPNVAAGSQTDLRNALTAAIGRFSQYGVNLNYGKDGKLLPVGKGVGRNFATQEYESYAMDSWRVKSNLTLTYGVRWSTSTPVYETSGIQVKPTPSLSDFFAQRVAGSFNGQPYNGLIKVDLAGKVNGRSGYYDQDWNNFAPNVSVAWSPNFKDGLLGKVFGQSKTTLRGGFRMVYDRIGSALAVAFDLNSTLGFTSAKSVAANTYNVGSRLGPLYTGLGQDVRTLPNIGYSSTLTFPLQTPADGDQRIEQSLDDKLKTPYNYQFNFSVGRELGKGYALEVSYVGRVARNLLVSRDVATMNNLRDPKSGVDFYTAMRQLIALRNSNAAITSVQNIAYFENLLPGLAGTYSVLGSSVKLSATQAAYRRIAQRGVGGRNTTDWTFVQALWNNAGANPDVPLFFHPQYATFAAYSTIGTSDYHSLQMSLRKRFTKDLYFDFNYTLSHSLDMASGNESSGTISSGASLILNPYDLNANRGNSDFDVRHLINANFGYNLPFGRGQRLFANLNPVANALFGGWRLTGIFRWNTGFPIGDPYDDARWATNWNVQSNAIQIRPVQSSPTRTGDPNLFSNTTAAYQSYRNAYPGEVGDRNVLRAPGFVQFDTGLLKEFKIRERFKTQFRWETFNLTNTQHFTGLANLGIGQDPSLGGTPPSDWGKFTRIQGTPRIMQFALRVEF